MSHLINPKLHLKISVFIFQVSYNMISLGTALIRLALVMIILVYTFQVWRVVNQHFNEGIKMYMEKEKKTIEMKSRPIHEYSKTKSTKKKSQDVTCAKLNMVTYYSNKGVCFKK